MEQHRHKGATVSLGGGLARYIERLAGTLPDGVADAVHRGAATVLSQAINAWPVKTGRSKRGLSIEVIRNDSGRPVAQARLFNNVVYTRWIRQKGFKERRTWIRLVEAPARRMAPEIYRVVFAHVLEVMRAA